MRKTLTFFSSLLAATALLSACGSSSKTTARGGYNSGAAASSSESTSTIKTAFVSSLHATALVDAGGMTLYHLTGEGNGKFICTSSACLGVWHPVTVASGVKPSGSVASLSTVKRPDGTTQVTFEGAPLYTFTQDTKPGQASGQGFKDVGTWMVATTTSASSPSTTPTTTTSTPASGESAPSGGGGSGY